MSETLPKCPLCGTDSIKWLHADHVECRNPKCALFSDNGCTEAEWRRLASPPMPPEVVAVLRETDAALRRIAFLLARMAIENGRLADGHGVHASMATDEEAHELVRSMEAQHG